LLICKGFRNGKLFQKVPYNPIPKDC